MNWDAQLYDNNHEYVAEYGKGLLEFVPHKPNQAILDLGCGTGTLTAQLKRKEYRMMHSYLIGEKEMQDIPAFLLEIRGENKAGRMILRKAVIR